MPESDAEVSVPSGRYLRVIGSYKGAPTALPFEFIGGGPPVCVALLDETAATEIERWLSELPVEHQTSAPAVLRLAEFLIRFSSREG